MLLLFFIRFFLPTAYLSPRQSPRNKTKLPNKRRKKRRRNQVEKAHTTHTRDKYPFDFHFILFSDFLILFISFAVAHFVIRIFSSFFFLVQFSFHFSSLIFTSQFFSVSSLENVVSLDFFTFSFGNRMVEHRAKFVVDLNSFGRIKSKKEF